MAARVLARTSAARAKFAFYFAAVLALGLLLKLVHVQIVKGAEYARDAQDQRRAHLDLFGRRGNIFDRDGAVLVRSMPTQSVYASTDAIPRSADARAKLAVILHRDPRALDRELHGHDGYRLIERKIGSETAARIRALDIPGIDVVPEETGARFAPAGRLASTVIGFVGIEDNGLDGAEYAFDAILRGSSGRMNFEADQSGRPIPYAPTTVVSSAHPGRSIALTIDSYLQFEAERTIAAAVKKYSALSGTAIVMDPWTGEILALANVPDFEPTHFSRYPADALRDRAVMDAYEPGSTFKLITAAAALQSGRVGADSRFFARDTLEVGGRTIHNAEDGFMAGTSGTESLEDIIAYSHNVGAAEVGMAIGKSALFAGIRSFGFGDLTHIELPGENPGIVNPPAEWSGSSLATISFGHGISVTPIAMLRAYAAIANGGMLVRPRVLSALYEPGGRLIYRYHTEIEGRAITQQTAATLRRFLRAVVVRGTGNPTAQIPGYTTAGKTGTAQVVENGRYLPGAYIASFIGMIPAGHPRYVILVKVDRPRGEIYGSLVAAPVFAQLGRAAMLHAAVFPDPRLLPKPSPSPAAKNKR